MYRSNFVDIMPCRKCGGKGFLESFIMRDNAQVACIEQCCDVKAYSAEIKRRVDRMAREDRLKMVVDNNVIQFPIKAKSP